jgi:hypothetical protein
VKSIAGQPVKLSDGLLWSGQWICGDTEWAEAAVTIVASWCTDYAQAGYLFTVDQAALCCFDDGMFQ